MGTGELAITFPNADDPRVIAGSVTALAGANGGTLHWARRENLRQIGYLPACMPYGLRVPRRGPGPRVYPNAAHADSLLESVTCKNCLRQLEDAAKYERRKRREAERRSDAAVEKRILDAGILADAMREHPDVAALYALYYGTPSGDYLYRRLVDILLAGNDPFPEIAWQKEA